MADMKPEMSRVYPPLPHCPPNHRFAGISELYAQYVARLTTLPVIDPLGRRIYFLPENFPHLVKLEFFSAKTKGWTDAKAGPAVTQLEAGTLDEGLYRIGDRSRLRTLFWVPDVLRNPDAVYDNKRGNGTDVYIKRYRRDRGPSIKIALVTERPDRRSVVVTSFWTDAKYLRSCIEGLPKHSAKQ